MPAATEATDISTSAPLVDNETLDFIQYLVEYDKRMETARRLEDEKAERRIRKLNEDVDMFLKRHRGLNPKLQEELDRDLMRTQVDREALRARLRDQDKAALALKKEAKIARQKDQAAARARKEERGALESSKCALTRDGRNHVSVKASPKTTPRTSVRKLTDFSGWRSSA